MPLNISHTVNQITWDDVITVKITPLSDGTIAVHSTYTLTDSDGNIIPGGFDVRTTVTDPAVVAQIQTLVQSELLPKLETESGVA